MRYQFYPIASDKFKAKISIPVCIWSRGLTLRALRVLGCAYPHHPSFEKAMSPSSPNLDTIDFKALSKWESCSDSSCRECGHGRRYLFLDAGGVRNFLAHGVVQLWAVLAIFGARAYAGEIETIEGRPVRVKGCVGRVEALFLPG
jgi:hypothetical protein